MPEITNSVAKVDTTFPPSERYIFLTNSDFDGGTGEGDFINGNGPDYINVFLLLKRKASKIEMYVQETTGGAADAVAISVLLNRDKKVFTYNPNRDKTVIPRPFLNMDESITVTNPANPIQIRAETGQTIVWNYDSTPFSDLEIDMALEGAGAIGNFSIRIS